MLIMRNAALLNVALKEYGITEIQGHEDNVRILQYFKDIGHAWVKDDETAWCSAFLNWCCLQSGLERSGKLDARSWLNVGQKIDNPEPGDVAVFWRESLKSWKGHAGIYINKKGFGINVLGGNQSNKVCIRGYPVEQLLGYRRLNFA